MSGCESCEDSADYLVAASSCPDLPTRAANTALCGDCKDDHHRPEEAHG